MVKAETEFKRWWLKNWSGWYETYEPRRGSGVGIPDVQVAVNGRLIPLEFKIGEIDENEVLWIDEVRPDQTGWHKRAALAGIKTFFVVGVRNRIIKAPAGLKYEICYVPGDKIARWDDGLSSVVNFNYSVSGLVYLI